MILRESVYHRMGQNWSYAYDEATLHIRIRTKRGNVAKVELLYGDKYGWEHTHDAKQMQLLASDAYFDYWQAAVQPPYRRLAYYFALYAEEEVLYVLEKGFFTEAPTIFYEGLFDFPFLNREDVHRMPHWAKDAVFYQIFPERFACGDPSISPQNAQPWGGVPTPRNFFGGDLQGVLNHLDYLSDLGINAIYFTPLFEATTNHKYDTRDYFRIDPHFGTNDLLKTLVDACHARGIRVLLDGVFNHCGHTFPPYVDVLEKGQASRYAGWFHVREWPPRVENGIPTYDTFAFEPIMPKFNTEHPEVQEYLLSVGRYWVQEIGIDGWRLDVANEVAHSFWREFRKAVREMNPEAFLVGEIMHDALPWLTGDQFDAVMNYPLLNLLLNFFARGTADAGQFAHAVSEMLGRYPQQITEAAFNLLDSHDTERFLTHCGGDARRLRLALLYLMTYQGSPCIYYGDEIGMEGAYDPDNRRCMEWDPERQDRELLAFYRWAIALRKAHSALRGSGIRFLELAGQPAFLAYERWDEEERLVVLMNNSPAPLDFVLPLTDAAGTWTDLVAGEQATVTGGGLGFSLPAFGYAVLQRM